MNEQTLVVIKPDAVYRQLSGHIITRIEQTGLKIVAMKMIWADKKHAEQHYPLDEEWAKKMFAKTVAAHQAQGKVHPAKDHMTYGKLIQSYLINFLIEGPTIAMVIEGPHAVELLRKIIGLTEPRQAAPGTIRSDFASVESYAVSDTLMRPVKNLIHASDSVDNAKREISLWFKPNEIHSYATVHDRYLQDKKQN